jgi:anti-sigma regulatory factor (Ser/Thr protein kinase)
MPLAHSRLYKIKMIHEIEITASLGEVVKISEATRTNAEYLGFSVDDVYRIELSVVEAVTNCIKHGCNQASEKPVKVFFKLENELLNITIIDYGKHWLTFEEEINKPSPFNFSSGNPDEIPQRGMGLAMVLDSMDDVQYIRNNDHNVFILSKKLPDHP